MRAAWLGVALLAGLAQPGARPQGSSEPPASRTTLDQEAMSGFDFYLGRWVEPGDEPRHALDFSWAIEGKSLRIVELERVDGELRVQSEALVGWHYGERALVYHEFVRDSRPFEVMNAGRIRFEPGAVLVREFTSFDPDGSTRDWRERFTPDGVDAWRQAIEYRDDDGSWKAWRTLRGRRE